MNIVDSRHGRIDPTTLPALDETAEEMRREAEYEQDMLAAEMEAECRMAFYDDDPSPYAGTYSEM